MQLDRDFALFLDEIIQKKIEKQLKEQKFVKAYPAKVVAVGSETADVKLIGDDINIINGLKNRTNQVLNIGDEVYLFSPTNNFTNVYIAVKK